jgi:hypothetical protein
VLCGGGWDLVAAEAAVVSCVVEALRRGEQRESRVACALARRNERAGTAGFARPCSGWFRRSRKARACEMLDHVKSHEMIGCAKGR